MKFLPKKHITFNIMDIMKRNCSKYYINLLVATIFIFVSSQTYGQSNQCSYSGTPITVGTSCSYSTFSTNTNNDYWNGASGCNSADLDDKWWYFTATGTTTTITYATVNSNDGDAILHLFTGACGTNMTALTCADNGGTFATETISDWPTTIGQTYAIRIQRYNSNSRMDGSICVYSPAAPFTGCLTASNGLYPAATYTPSCTGSAETITTMGYAGEYSKVNVISGVEYTFTSSVSSDYTTISNEGGTIVYDYGQPSVTWTSTITGVVRFYTHSTSVCGEESVSRTRSVQCSPEPPANDACADATSLPCATSALAGTTVSTVAESAPGGTGVSYGVWYTFEGDGLSTTISSVASFDHEQVLLSGSCGSLTLIDNADGFMSGGTETYTFTSTIGTTYYVYIAHYSTSSTETGTFTISRTCVSPPPSNDECAAATSLPCATSALAGTTENTIAESAPGSTASQYGVWYTFTGDGLSTTISSVASFDHEQVLLSGSCGSLTLINNADAWTAGGTETYTFTSTIGTTYYVYIAHYSTSSTETGTFTISRTCVEPPANDACADATSLPCATSGLAGTTENTVIESSPDNQASDYGVWYTFTGDGLYTTISTTGTGLNQEMTIVYGTCGSYTLETTQDESSSTTGTETYSFIPTNGVDYYVYVAYYLNTGTSSQTGTFTISRDCPSAPANDACAAATSLPCATSALAGTTVATVAETAPGGTSSDYGVWYTFTGDGVYTTISSTGTGLDQEMTIVSTSCAGAVVATVDASSSTTGTESYSFYPTNGTQYYVYISHTTPGSTTLGTFTISRTCTAAPANDACAAATNLPCATSNLAGTTVATIAETPPSSTSDYGVWYEFTGDGQSTTISSVASGFNHEMTVLSGSCGSFTVLSDVDGAGSGGTESYTFTTVASTQYYVFIAHNTASSSTQGTFTISRTCVAAPPVNDDPCSATTLTVGTSCSFATYTNVAATASSGVPAPGCASYQGEDVWFSVTVPASGSLTVDMGAGGITDAGMAIYSGTCSSLTLIQCDDDGGSGMMSMIALTGQTPGATLWIRVWEYGGNVSGTFDICTYDIPPCVPCDNSVALVCGTDIDWNSSSANGCWDPTTGTSALPGTESVFSFTPSVSGTYDITFSTDQGNVELFGRMGACVDASTGWTFLAESGIASTAVVSVWLTGGTAYTFLIDDEDVTASNGIINMGCCSAPDGGVDNVLAITASQTIFSSTTLGKCNHCDDSPSEELVLEIQITCAGEYTFNTCTNTAYDTYLYLSETSACGNVIASNDDGCGTQSVLTTTLDIGSYYLAVEGYVGSTQPVEDASGAFDLEILTSCSFSSLPVELVFFEGENRNGKNVLDWQTASETNNDYFLLERSEDGTNFNELAIISGSGNTHQTNNYSFTDETFVDGINYYRLTQVDFDGVAEVFSAIAIYSNSNEDISVFPNPSSGIINVALKSKWINPKLSIVNQLGQEVFSSSFLSGNDIILDFNDKPGVYFLTVKSERNIFTRKLIVK